MRLDLALTERGLTRSRNQAAQLIAEGKVLIDGRTAMKASQPVDHTADLQIDEQPWVSRAAHKLLGALDQSETRVPARVLDAGASTGGFTAVCLERGAERVYAVDVGHGQLAAELREDPRVVVHEGTNLRDLTLDHVEAEPVDLVVADVSFISLRLILEPMLAVLTPDGVALLLIKPQFEVGREQLGAGGLVKDEQTRLRTVAGVIEYAEALGWHCDWQGVSALPGTAGNIEYFVRLRPTGPVRRAQGGA